MKRRRVKGEKERGKSEITNVAIITIVSIPQAGVLR